MELIVTTEERLNELIESAMRRVVLRPESPTNIDEKSNLRIDEAVVFLNDRGYKVSKSLLYNLTHKREIPFKKFGSSLIFNKTDLEAWARKRNDGGAGVDHVQLMAQNAKRKSQYTKK